MILKILSIFVILFQLSDTASIKVLTKQEVEKYQSNGKKSPSLVICRKNIESIEENAFEDQYQLTKLEVPYNNLKHLNGNLFSNTRYLQQISFSVNKIESIDAYLFNGLYNLQQIKLSYNNLRTLDSYLFNGLNELIELKNNNQQNLRITD